MVTISPFSTKICSRYVPFQFVTVDSICSAHGRLRMSAHADFVGIVLPICKKINILSFLLGFSGFQMVGFSGDTLAMINRKLLFAVFNL